MKDRQRNLHVAWTEHIQDPEEKEKFKTLLRNSTISLGRLREILERKLEEMKRGELRIQNYESPNWAFKQADTNGAIRVLQNVLDMLEFTKRGR